MRYFLVNLIIIFFISKMVLANMEEPTISTSETTDTLINKQSIHTMIEAGEYELAKSNLMNFIKTNNSDHEAYNLLGYVERQLQNYKLAISFYKKSLSIESNFIGAHHYIAVTYLEIDDLKSAKYHLDQLDLICLFGCEDFYDLKNRIAFYEANNE
jgi:tetratricopeptide (TPR) repeat protein